MRHAAPFLVGDVLQFLLECSRYPKCELRIFFHNPSAKRDAPNESAPVSLNLTRRIYSAILCTAMQCIQVNHEKFDLGMAAKSQNCTVDLGEAGPRSDESVEIPHDEILSHDSIGRHPAVERPLVCDPRRTRGNCTTEKVFRNSNGSRKGP